MKRKKVTSFRVELLRISGLKSAGWGTEKILENGEHKGDIQVTSEFE